MSEEDQNSGGGGKEGKRSRERERFLKEDREIQS